ncbi:Hypothetical protein NTJ_13931 [Nesidiocoris tenuis]|uniref:Uncharacterized protein n=1 Tax=Nesidiocoris tenuis TaxID=355587 RepID=A0ABN7BBT0_9HEMI|nr:Hypothetical protein NTJ_13931 [Nesidiocoris tenuis]
MEPPLGSASFDLQLGAAQHAARMLQSTIREAPPRRLEGKRGLGCSAFASRSRAAARDPSIALPSANKAIGEISNRKLQINSSRIFA